MRRAALRHVPRRRELNLVFLRTDIAFNICVKVLIVKRPTGTVDGVALKRYTPGEVYELSPSIADYLVIQGFALPEMRRRGKPVIKKKSDRRR